MPRAQHLEAHSQERQHHFLTDDREEELRASKRRRTDEHCDSVGALGDNMTGSLRASLPPLEGAAFIDPASNTVPKEFSSDTVTPLSARAREEAECTGFAVLESAHASSSSLNWHLTPTSREAIPNLSSPKTAAMDAETKDNATPENGGHSTELRREVGPECATPERLPAHLPPEREVIDVDALDDIEVVPRIRISHRRHRSTVPKKEDEPTASLSAPLLSLSSSGHGQAFNHARIARAFKSHNGALECRMCLYVLRVGHRLG